MALTLLLIGVIGPLAIAARNVSNAGLTQNTAIATFLAQEAVETIRNIRDHDVLSGSTPGGGWPSQATSALNGCLTTAATPAGAEISCMVDGVNDSVTASCGGANPPCTPLQKGRSTGLYYQGTCTDGTGCDPSIFTRTFTLRQASASADHELWLIVTVRWPDERAAGNTRSYILRSALFRN